MIISHKYKYIFLKTNKTAGTSIEIALSKFCGEDDVITPISPEDEEMRRLLGYKGPQNYQSNDTNEGEFYNHIPAKEIKELISSEVWDNYFKFCFERNPWDRFVSLYYWRYKSEPRPSITKFLETSIPLALKRRGYDVYTINSKVVVDRICRFEHLPKELEKIRSELNIPEELELPRAKVNFRKNKSSYREILNDKERAKIASLFIDEITLFGYEF